MKDFSKKEAIKFGFEKAKANLGFFIPAFIIYLVVQSLPNMFSGMLENANSVQGISFIFFIITLATIIVRIILDLGLIQVGLNIVDGKKPEFNTLFSKANNYMLLLKYFGAGILYGLAVAVGFILLIIPGIILAIRLQYFSYLLVEKNLGVIDALKGSWEMTKGATWNLFLFGLLIVLINILGMLALVIGLLITIPTSMVAQAYVYRKLRS